MSRYITKLLLRLEQSITPTLNNPNEKNKRGEYPYIPLDYDHFVEQLSVICGFRNTTFNFIDVGCGIGTKLLLVNDLARSFYVDNRTITGIEITPEYVEVAKTLMPSEATIICGDALKYNYSPHNVIYFYCPFMNCRKQRKLEEHIVRTAKKGTYILANLKQNLALWENRRKVRHIWNGIIYQKV